MGYTSYMIIDEYNLKDADGLREELEILEADPTSFISVNIGNGQITVNEDGNLDLADPDGKWYPEWTEPLMALFARFGDGRIIFEGEDKRSWCYDFDGNGGVKYLEATTVYGDILEEVYNTYPLPDKLKADIRKYILSRKV
jgi:hypothetical protein